MDFKALIASLTPEAYQGLKQAVELGKWADGRVLEPGQRAQCLQLLIAYEHRQSQGTDEPFRIRPDGSFSDGKQQRRARDIPLTQKD